MILPTAEIVCLGNELLIGITINTNASFIGEKLTELGYEVRRVTCIRDEVDLSVEFFKELFKRKPKLVIVSGGLGPTYDDIQLKVISKSTELELQENSEALEQIKKYYSKRDLKLTKERRKMAFIPEGAKVLDNQVGGAPGCHVVYIEMDIYCLPGVPTEMKDIFNRHIFPYLRKQNEYQLFQRKFQITGCAESELAPFINEVKINFPELYIKSHPEYKGESGIVIHISGYGESEEKKVVSVMEILQNDFRRNFPHSEIKAIKE